jgi:acetyl-CoA acetyltransferase
MGPQLEQRGVEVKIVTVPEVLDAPVHVRASPRAAARIMHELLGQAVAATPRGLAVTVTVAASGSALVPGSSADMGARLSVDDAGASVPASARRAYAALELEPSTFGRPSSIPLFVCSELVAWQGALLELGDAPTGGLRVVINFAR